MECGTELPPMPLLIIVFPFLKDSYRLAESKPNQFNPPSVQWLTSVLESPRATMVTYLSTNFLKHSARAIAYLFPFQNTNLAF